MAKLIGTDPNQVPTNADLGTMAYQDAENPRLNNVVISGTPNDDAQGTLLRVKRGPSESGTWSTVAIEAQTANGNSRIAFVNDIEPSPADAHGMIDFEHQTNRLQFFVDGSEAAHFNSSGNLAFPDGQGIDFSASAGSGASSSVLDDYEEGTFTAEYYGGGGGTYSKTGYYRKIGSLVTIKVDIYNQNFSGFSGTIKIRGLPFTSFGTEGQLGGSFMYSGSTFDGIAYIGTNRTYFDLYHANTGGPNIDSLEIGDFANSSQASLWLSASYITSA